MRRRRHGPSLAANPVLIGAATTLVVVVAVFLAYNANTGLPFVPTYRLQAEIPSAANLVKGNDVRIGGTRIGIIDRISTLRRPNGEVTALLDMKLETSVKELPVDSTMIVRSRSALGLKYVQVTRGTSSEGFADGARIPLSNATPRPVEIDQVFNTFDQATRAASRTNVKEFGTALAGRGQNLNQAIAALPRLLRNLEPVARTLADPKTGLDRFFAELGDAARIVAPAGEAQGELFANLDTTFAALADVARPYIQDSISGGPPALRAATRAFPVQRPFLRDSQVLFTALRPGFAALRSAAPDLADAFSVGAPVLARSGPFNEQLRLSALALQRFSEDPLVPVAIRDLLRTVTVLGPALDFVAPAQTTCNYATLFFRNIASALSQGDSHGTWLRFQIIQPPSGPNNEAGPSSGAADGPSADNHLHATPYPNAAAPGQTPECEAGRETYDIGRTVVGNDAGNQGLETEQTTSDFNFDGTRKAK